MAFQREQLFAAILRKTIFLTIAQIFHSIVAKKPSLWCKDLSNSEKCMPVHTTTFIALDDSADDDKNRSLSSSAFRYPYSNTCPHDWSSTGVQLEFDWSSIGVRLEFDWSSIGVRLEFN